DAPYSQSRALQDPCGRSKHSSFPRSGSTENNGNTSRNKVSLISMSQYYNPRRTRNVFDPQSSDPFKLSRSKIDLFINCPRCFYFDIRLGVARPPGFPLTLNNAVDLLMKKEFDTHRVNKTKHPLMETYGIDAVPLDDPNLEEWRDALRSEE